MFSKLKSLIERSSRDQEPQRRERVTIADDVAAIYAVPDIHGCFEELLDAERRIFRDAAFEDIGKFQIVYLGDYVDRGPQSSAVVQHLLEPPQREDFQRLCLCGNHDDVMCRFILDPITYARWLENGGAETLASYGVDSAAALRQGGIREVAREASEAVPAAHLEWLAGLPVMARRRNIVFAHAGLRPGVSLAAQTEEDLMWIREPFLTDGPDDDLFVVHGHTITPEAQFEKNRIGLDTGAYLTGKLQVLKLSGQGMVLI